MPNFGENTRDFLQFPIYYYDVVYSQSLPVRGYAGAASVLLNGWDPIALAPTLVHTDASGNLAVSGSISATTSAVATAAAPTYVEGSTNPLSMDLGGGIRITGTINASSTVKSTAAAPSYIEGSSNPFSSDLSGGLRVIGAFFPATQPVSLAASVAVTNTGLTNLDVALSTRTKPSDQQHVIVDSSASIAVTGTFFPATQPVSGSVSITGGVAVADPNIDVLLSTRTKPSDQQHVIVDSSAAIAVTGTFYQVTQPVSLATLPDIVIDASTLPLQVSDNAQRIANMLSLRSLLLAQAGPSGFVPMETPLFLVG